MGEGINFIGFLPQNGRFFQQCFAALIGFFTVFSQVHCAWSQDVPVKLTAQTLEGGSQPIGYINPLNLLALIAAPEKRLGSFIIRPSISNQMVHESDKSGDSENDRAYYQTDLNLSLQSDWARHALSIDATSRLETNLSGTVEEDPNASVSALLGLDISSLMSVDIGADYKYSVEDRTDPNGLTDATGQADVHQFAGALTLNKKIGILRGSVTGAVSKSNYGNATLSDGTLVSGADRDVFTSSVTLRLQYAANELLMPFIEAGYRRGSYDQTFDDDGLQRSYSGHSGRVGLIHKGGNNFSSEFAIGYNWRDIDDASLTDFKILSMSSSANWSPRRGTNIALDFSTRTDASTSSGVSGSVLYALESTIKQELSRRVDVSAGMNYGVRRYKGTSAPNDENIVSATLGLNWLLNRYVSLSANTSYGKTSQSGSDDIDNYQIGVGLTLTR